MVKLYIVSFKLDIPQNIVGNREKVLNHCKSICEENQKKLIDWFNNKNLKTTEVGNERVNSYALCCVFVCCSQETADLLRKEFPEFTVTEDKEMCLITVN